MATHKSAIKRHRQSEKRRERNRQARSALRSSIKNALQVMKGTDKPASELAVRSAVRLIDKAVVHGLIKKNNGRNKVSRLMRRLSSPN
jgi:small subunit ribosomal protein S20